MPVSLPDGLVQATVAREGAAGEAWVRRLPVVVDELLQRWECTPDGAASHGGVALVVPVRTSDGQAAVLKVSFTHPGNEHEPIALAAWDGVGAVRLLQRWDPHYAMLLERVTTTSLASLADTEQVMAVAGTLSRQLAILAPAASRPLGAALEDWRADIERGSAELPGLFNSAVVEAALRTLADADGSVLVHGDLHAGNVLWSDDRGWLAIDPKGYAGDRAFDAGITVKWVVVTAFETDQGPEGTEREARRALNVFADAAELDRERARAWAHVHALQGAFWARRYGIRRARQGPQRDHVIALADHLANQLAYP